MGLIHIKGLFCRSEPKAMPIVPITIVRPKPFKRFNKTQQYISVIFVEMYS